MQGLLPDTHAVLWHAESAAELPAAVKALIDAPGRPRYVSRVSLLEIVIKLTVGKLPLPQGFEALLTRLEAVDLRILPLTNHHLRAYLQLPFFADHRDSFDRLLLAQAQAENLTLVSRDPKMRRYDSVAVVWTQSFPPFARVPHQGPNPYTPYPTPCPPPFSARIPRRVSLKPPPTCWPA